MTLWLLYVCVRSDWYRCWLNVTHQVWLMYCQCLCSSCCFSKLNRFTQLIRIKSAFWHLLDCKGCHSYNLRGFILICIPDNKDDLINPSCLGEGVNSVWHFVTGKGGSLADVYAHILPMCAYALVNVCIHIGKIIRCVSSQS